MERTGSGILGGRVPDGWRLGSHVWLSVPPTHVLVAQLLREDLPEDKPVAVYRKQKRYAGVLRMSKHPYLEIDPAAMDTLDSLIST